jgi:indoleamine 2,3-dioxygenase
VADAIELMGISCSHTREGCHPVIFYHRVRPFLAGWKHNPTLPNGIIYSGVSNERKQYYGGSAAQSALLPVLDIGLGVKHENEKSREFLTAMRDYMMKPHRDFLTYLETIANIRDFAAQAKVDLQQLESASQTQHEQEIKILRRLITAYDLCVSNLKDFRTIHMAIVADYIVAQQRAAVKVKCIPMSMFIVVSANLTLINHFKLYIDK